MARARKPEPVVVEDVIPLHGDTIRLGGKTYTVGRSIAMGLVVRVAGGVAVTDKGRAFTDSQGQKDVARADRARDWARKQGLEPETTEDGRIVRRKRPQPLMPKNVTPDGVPVEDDETLEQIAARTAAIEAAHLAELEDEADG